MKRREKVRYKVEVHVNGYCFCGDHVLLRRREEDREIFPGHLAGIGGQVQHDE